MSQSVKPHSLRITVIGGSGDEPAMPHVDGLEFNPMGQSTEYQSINGTVTASSSHTYLVTATRAGQFTIPAIKIGQGRNAETTQPVVLEVSVHRPRPPLPRAGDDRPVRHAQQAFLRLVTPKRILHVGELVPVQIKAYFRGGMQATINGLPALSSDAFTLNSLDDKPVQTQEKIDGQPYVILTWTTALSAVKAGDYSLSLELPVLLTVREKASKPHDLFGDTLFADSFFDDFFGNSVEKQVTLTSEPDTISIRPLPSANRPAGFSGALGQFTVAAEATPDHVTAGDPITLRLTVTGRGNFDRVSSGLLTKSHDWKSYKPVARFAPADSIGSEGTKTFEQAVVPLQAGHLKIPPLSFSYFDPETAKYVTRTTTPLAIDVARGREFDAGRTSRGARPATWIDQSLRPIESNRDNSLRRCSRCSCNRGFSSQTFLPGSASRRSSTSSAATPGMFATPSSRRARLADRAIHDQLAAMDSAMQHAETAAFFAAARRALQQRLGERWGLPPESITLTEINARLNGEADGIRPVFQMADQVAYSRENLPIGDLAGWKRILTEQLKQLERP